MTFLNCFGRFETVAWNFAQLAVWLVVWQCGRTAKSVRALLDALAVSANSFEPRMDANNGSGSILPGLADPNQLNRTAEPPAAWLIETHR